MDGYAGSNDQITALDMGTNMQRLSNLEFSIQPIKSMSMPSVVVISNGGVGETFLTVHPVAMRDNNFHVSILTESNGDDGPSTKRLLLEAVNADGKTFVITLHGDNSGGYHALPVVDNEKCHEVESKSRSVESVSQTWFTSREDKTSFESKGHSWRQGMWSKEEVDLLEANISKYCVENDIVDPAAVIFEMSKDERKDFYRLVAKGLNRPLFSVYRRVIRMYDNKNHVGKYTDDEMKRLKDLRIQHGNNWQLIGHELGRSASSIKDKCRLMKDNCNTGKWFPCEEDRLAEAVYELSGAVPGEMVTTGVSWASVAERVSTRSEKQCRTKWLNFLNWKQVGGSDWTRDDDAVLVTKVCSLAANDENEVDWVRLSAGWGSVRSPQWLRGKWWNLKRNLSNGSGFSFKEICSQLFASHVINVHKKVDDIEVADDDCDNDPVEDCVAAEDCDGDTAHDGLSTDSDVSPETGDVTSLKSDSSMQTMPMITLKSNGSGGETPSTLFIMHNPTSSISTKEINSRTLSVEAFHSAYNLPSQIITFTTPHLATTIQSAAAVADAEIIDDKGQLECCPPHGDLLMHNLELHQANDDGDEGDGELALRSQLSIEFDSFHNQSVDDCTALSIHDDIESQDENASHPICKRETTHLSDTDFISEQEDVIKFCVDGT